jgi:hypothetical protein
MRFTQDGSIDSDVSDPATGPYLSIAQEIAAYDDRNYPGIPPANPAKAAIRLQDAVYTTSSDRVETSSGPVSVPVSSSAGFVVGLQILLDVEDDRHIQEAVLVTEVPDANHIIVDKLAHTHDGTDLPFPGTATWRERSSHRRMVRIHTQLRNRHRRD